MSADRIPGAKGQPPSTVKGPSFDTMGWLHTTSPKTDYEDRQGNPGQLTAPMTPHAPNNDSEKMSMPGSSNELNGGVTIFSDNPTSPPEVMGRTFPGPRVTAPGVGSAPMMTANDINGGRDIMGGGGTG